MNKVMLLGCLAKDAEKRTTQNGMSICSFGLVTSKKYKDKNGETKESSEYHSVDIWNASDKLVNFLSKGSKVLVDGELKYSEFTDKNNEKKRIAKINCLKIELCSSPKSQKKTDESIESKPSIDDEIPF